MVTRHRAFEPSGTVMSDCFAMSLLEIMLVSFPFVTRESIIKPISIIIIIIIVTFQDILSWKRNLVDWKDLTNGMKTCLTEPRLALVVKDM